MGAQQDVLLLILSPTGDGGNGLEVKDQFYFHSLIDSVAEECFNLSPSSPRRFKSISTKHCDCGKGEQKLENKHQEKFCISL